MSLIHRIPPPTQQPVVVVASQHARTGSTTHLCHIENRDWSREIHVENNVGLCRCAKLQSAEAVDGVGQQQWLLAGGGHDKVIVVAGHVVPLLHVAAVENKCGFGLDPHFKRAGHSAEGTDGCGRGPLVGGQAGRGGVSGDGVAFFFVCLFFKKRK